MKNTGLKKVGVALAAGVIFFLIALLGRSTAQGFSGLSKLLGGGSTHTGNSSQSNAAVTLQRDAAPYEGNFNGKQNEGSKNDDLRAQFACYPAHDPALPQTKAFVCYSAE